MTVKIYTTNTCPYCIMAKDYLKRRGVRFEELNVENDATAANEMMAKTGQFGVPVLDIDGKVIVGFDKNGIDRAIEGLKK